MRGKKRPSECWGTHAASKAPCDSGQLIRWDSESHKVRGTGGETGQMAERFVPGERAQEVVAPEKSSAGKLVVGLGRETYSND